MFLLCSRLTHVLAVAFAFPYTTYNSGSADSFAAACAHAASLADVQRDMTHTFASSYGAYVLYSEARACPSYRFFSL